LDDEVSFFFLAGADFFGAAFLTFFFAAMVFCFRLSFYAVSTKIGKKSYFVQIYGCDFFCKGIPLSRINLDSKFGMV
jgi:hypothetical protein